MSRIWLGMIVALAVVAVGVVLMAPEVFFPGEQPEKKAPLETAQAPESDTQGGNTATSAPSGEAPPREEEEAIALEEEAEEYVERLAEPTSEPVPVERADHFVRPDRALSLVTEEVIEEMTPEELFADPSLEADTPITIVKEVEQVERTTPEKIIAESGGDLEKRVKVLEGDEVRETTVRKLLEEHQAEPEKPINIVKNLKYFEKTTPRELKEDRSLSGKKRLRIIRTPYSLTMATVAQLVGVDKEVAADAIFYVRTVQPGDEQGIWGIIHHGLIENFARGIAIRRGEALDTYRVEIPEHADERLPDNSSSYLGKLIFEKTKQSSVYNFKVGRIGKNPNLINPGQEIVIVSFTPEELIAIYKHFVNEQG
ncbi:MAG: hypothetical protein GWN84_11290 [Gammaproteobacteria bacterium]|nr:hypothetical protein [Gammaproteobacteria bacterium]NIR83449.1 hypothetical protein [Gammaproteobacteria bacterium]NIR91371.1 hypothetical protein [Gammaproteobacteria bacterium]NIU04611.1 hypothetical protein [Gammaproteobacteria bacterium]NIV51653.1 hypothetical protein [Gammaproteobacteria bacterium]